MTQKVQAIQAIITSLPNGDNDENIHVTYLHIEKLFPRTVMKYTSALQLVTATLAVISQVSLSITSLECNSNQDREKYHQFN